MMRRFLVLAIAAVLPACSSPTPRLWEKEGATPEMAKIDLVACRQAARQEALYQIPYAGYGGRVGMGPYPYRYAWRGPYGSGAELRYDRENRLTVFCMRTKGYELVTVPAVPTVSPGIVRTIPAPSPPPDPHGD